MRDTKLNSLRSSRGFTLIEVLVTVVVLAIGLLGLALLQTTSLNNQLESYHRAQAMMLLEEMSNRIRVNADEALLEEYEDGTDYGLRDKDDFGLDADENCVDIEAGDPPGGVDNVAVKRDLCQWNFALAGSGVVLDGTNLGSVNGAVGCIENIDGSGDGERIVRLTIAWQGMAGTSAPDSTCGEGDFGDGDAGDEFRRVAILDAVIAELDI